MTIANTKYHIRIVGLPLAVTLAGCNHSNDSSTGTGTSSSGGTVGGIGPAGGSVNGFYGAQVTVPAGALSTSVDIAITRDSTGEPDLPANGIDTAGAPYALTPHGTAFAQVATVRVPFDADRIPTDATPVLYQAEPGGAFTAIPTTVDNNMLVTDVTNFSWVIPGYASTRSRMVYALTNNGTLGVSSFKITKTTGALSAATGTAPVGDRPISVSVHPSRRFAYVTNAGSNTVNGISPNSISVYRLDPVTGVISGPTDTKQVNGNPISAVVHPTGKFVYVVNEVRFGSPIGNVSVFAVDATTGALSASTTTADSGGAPATAIAFSASGKFAYVTYLHAVSTPVNNTYWDTVQTYSVDSATGQLSGPIGSAPTGDNPWAIAVTPGGHFAYVASLSTQNGVNELSTYSINSTGVAYLQSSTSVQSQPSSLAMDPEGRFLYVGKQQPYYNQNLVVYSINASSGALTAASAVLLGSGPQVGPIAVVADPQGQFVYAMDSTNGNIVPFTLNASSGTLTAGTPVGGVLAGGATGGVGDPFTFAASGTSPVWEDACTQMIEYYIQAGAFPPTGGCFLPILSSTADGSGGNATTPPPSAAATHQMNVSAGVWVNEIISTPAGIDYPSKVVAGFATGTAVALCETPDPSQVFDVKWTGTGGCVGTGTCTTVQMDHDQSCHVELTPVSTR